jgi:hypothetical protein
MAIDSDTSRDHLTALAGALLAWQGVSAKVRTGHDGGAICVATNMCAPMISEEITVMGGDFMYSWGDVISPVDDIPTAAILVIRVIKDQEHVGQSLPDT